MSPFSSMVSYKDKNTNLTLNKADLFIQNWDSSVTARENWGVGLILCPSPLIILFVKLVKFV